MAEFTVDNLARLGISFGSPEDAAAFCEALRDDYYTRIGQEIARVLTPEQLEEYDSTPEEALAGWLERNCPDYVGICADKFAQVAMELFLRRGRIAGMTASTALEEDGTQFIDFMLFLPVSFRKWMISNGVYTIGQFFGKLESFDEFLARRPVPASFVIMQLWDYLTEDATGFAAIHVQGQPENASTNRNDAERSQRA